ncbi:MAG: hypothetical protein Q4C03_06110 [bacterium]|nr:hypothetical protein [bacterium]
MWKLWKSASSPCTASKTALENLRIKPSFSTPAFILAAAFEAQYIPFRFMQGDFLPVLMQNRSTKPMNIHVQNPLFHSFHTLWKTFCGKRNRCFEKVCGFSSHFVLAFLHKTDEFG